MVQACCGGCRGARRAYPVYGVERLVESKRLSWQQYREFYCERHPADITLPRPLNEHSLQWGVQDKNTCRSLLPERLLPWIFVLAWVGLFVTTFTASQ